MSSLEGTAYSTAEETGPHRLAKIVIEHFAKIVIAYQIPRYVML
jgi:hypothetical protein